MGRRWRRRRAATPADNMPAMDLSIEGRACVITGGSQGIGLGTARALAAEGARLLLVGRREGARVAVPAPLGPADDTVATSAADVTSPDAAEAIAAECHRRFGQ